MVQEIISNINNYIWGYPYILLLALTSIYLSIKFRFPHLKILFAIKDMFKSKEDGNKDKITSFKSLMTVLAGTLGTGNIVSVAVALTIGGVGSLFWLFVSGIFAMVISYVENLVVLRYRKRDRKKGYFGGAMYVLDEVLDKRGLAIIFAVVVAMSAACTGTMSQSNSLSSLLNVSIGMDKALVGIILAILTAYIVFGGKTRIAKISSIIIPICTVLYVVLCFSIILVHRQNILPGLKEIIASAFGAKQFAGGMVGISLSKIIGKGFSLGMFSNEAGMGSAPIFTATVEEQDIDTQSKIAATSVVIDTIILCMLTGITIVSTGMHKIPDVGVMLNSVFGTVPFGNVVLNICMVFFVISTIPCWEYYGEEAIKYLFKSNIAIYLFRILYVIGIFFGSIMVVEVVFDLSGIANAIMTLPNLYMIYKCLKIDKSIYKHPKL